MMLDGKSGTKRKIQNKWVFGSTYAIVLICAEYSSISMTDSNTERNDAKLTTTETSGCFENASLID